MLQVEGPKVAGLIPNIQRCSTATRRALNIEIPAVDRDPFIAGDEIRTHDPHVGNVMLYH